MFNIMPSLFVWILYGQCLDCLFCLVHRVHSASSYNGRHTTQLLWAGWSWSEDCCGDWMCFCLGEWTSLGCFLETMHLPFGQRSAGLRDPLGPKSAIDWLVC
ncbi:hypothetical protein QBC32DRAFT_350200 [Pseudoneurospora amorphoporcata]|uniref:Secreted protein n=1 Tax=Pseudoneurospora amorphoporcata TaxID=241081 RepID=A0AAN6NQ36_9PEZI|nr:hypothetical protein QBC32DRAFT_350200 [Pseudoneurospora amorphoporcata]